MYEDILGDICCATLLHTLEGKSAPPAARKESRISKIHLCVMVGGDRLTSFHSQEKALGQAGKTCKQTVSLPERWRHRFWLP